MCAFETVLRYPVHLPECFDWLDFDLEDDWIRLDDAIET